MPTNSSDVGIRNNASSGSQQLGHGTRATRGAGGMGGRVGTGGTWGGRFWENARKSRAR